MAMQGYGTVKPRVGAIAAGTRPAAGIIARAMHGAALMKTSKIKPAPARKGK